MTDQIFGVDLEARSRADRKRVPILVTTILSYLDNRKGNVALLVAAVTDHDRLSRTRRR